jgi:hypothetical protein
MDKLKIILKERWMWYLIGGVFGYIVPILTYGVPSWEYLFPIRYVTIATTIGIGNSVYVGYKDYSIRNASINAVKSFIIVISLWLILFLFKLIILKSLNYDISPFINISQ